MTPPIRGHQPTSRFDPLAPSQRQGAPAASGTRGGLPGLAPRARAIAGEASRAPRVPAPASSQAAIDATLATTDELIAGLQTEESWLPIITRAQAEGLTALSRWLARAPDERGTLADLGKALYVRVLEGGNIESHPLVRAYRADRGTPAALSRDAGIALNGLIGGIDGQESINALANQIYTLEGDSSDDARYRNAARVRRVGRWFLENRPDRRFERVVADLKAALPLGRSVAGDADIAAFLLTVPNEEQRRYILNALKRLVGEERSWAGSVQSGPELRPPRKHPAPPDDDPPAGPA